MWPAQCIQRSLESFDSEVTFQNLDQNGEKIGEPRSAHSVMFILSVALNQGDQVAIKCVGPDSKETLSHLLDLFKTGFD